MRYPNDRDYDEDRRSFEEEREDALADAWDEAVECSECRSMVDPSEVADGSSADGTVRCYDCAMRAHDEYLDSRGIE
jgi:hypothetical protein